MKVQHQTLELLPDYANHLKSLTNEDRYTRFGFNIKDESIDQLILNMLYNKNDHHLFTAIVNDKIAGFGHLAKEDSDWELAVSVNKEFQGQGVAKELMYFMIAWGKTHGVQSVFMHCISQNQKIQHLARKFGLRTVERSGGEITAKVELPGATPLDYTSEFMREQKELAHQIIELQHKMLRNLNPLSYVTDHKVNQ